MADAPQPPTDDSTPKAWPSAKNGRAKIDKYFRAMTRHGASDLHMKADSPVKFRLHGEIQNIDDNRLTQRAIESMVFEIMDQQRIDLYQKKGHATASVSRVNDPFRSDRASRHRRRAAVYKIRLVYLPALA